MFYRSASLVITSSVMSCLAIVAVGLRFWAKRVRRSRIGADDFLIVIGLVRLFFAQHDVQTLLIIPRYWLLVCAYVILSEQRNSASGIMRFTSSPALWRAFLSPGYCLDMEKQVTSSNLESLLVNDGLMLIRLPRSSTRFNSCTLQPCQSSKHL